MAWSRATSTLRLFSSVARSASIEFCTPFSAPTAAHCDGADGPEVCCDWMLAHARISSRLPTPQPIRNPVIAYIFDTQLTTRSFDSSTSCFENAYTLVGVRPSNTRRL